MPEIPTSVSPQEGRYPSISPQAAAQPAAAAENAAEMATRLSMYGQQAAQRIQAAEDHVAALGAKNQIDADIDAAIQSFTQRSDHAAFPADVERMAGELRKKYAEQYANNPRVLRAINPVLESQLQGFQRTIEGKRVQLLQNDGIAELYKSRGAALLKMAETDNPEEKQAYRQEFMDEVAAMQDMNIITAQQQYQLETSFDLNAEKTEVIKGLRSNSIESVQKTLQNIEDHVYSNLESLDPDWLASVQATGVNWLNTLTENTKRYEEELAVNGALGALQEQFTLPDGTIDYMAARKVLANRTFQKEHGLVDEKGNPDRLRIQAVENYIKTFEGEQVNALKEIHDKFEKQIGDHYLKGEYSQLLKALRDPDNPLTGDEIRTWVNAVEEKRNADQQGRNETEAALAIIKTNDMLRRGEPIEKIRNAIVQNPYLNITEKKQQIAKIEADIDESIKDGRSQGYRDIIDIIIPAARMIAPEALILTPLQSIAIREAQIALDAWVDAQLAKDLRPTKSEIRIQAAKLADRYQPSFAEKMKYLEQVTQEIAGEK